MPCPNLIYIRTCARTHARTRMRSIVNSTCKRTQTHARKRTRTQINAHKLIVAFDAWAISACKRDCVLCVRPKTFRMYYTYTYGGMVGIYIYIYTYGILKKKMHCVTQSAKTNVPHFKVCLWIFAGSEGIRYCSTSCQTRHNFCQTCRNSANTPHFHGKKRRNPWIVTLYKTAHCGAAIKVRRTRWDKSGAHDAAFTSAATARLLCSL